MKQHISSSWRMWLLLLAAVVTLPAQAVSYAKREFRGAWIQAVNGQFQGLSPQAMRQTLTYQLDELQKDGVNAIIFQVRPECDALYPSNIEPWSRFLSGTQGQPPYPAWDPLQWMIEQCHARGMELHAWINPYRAKTKNTTALAPSHIARTRPDLVFEYDGQLILNPALQENRDYICRVVTDIVTRYDVDGLHIDDYFYPYPVPGKVIPDDNDYARLANGISNRADWRRYNVNLFMKQLHETIRKAKPWVKFGVSPFGIYRNKKSDPARGSNTNGLQNYDDLYADVLFWVENGWVDYCVPQVYWQIGHPAADYATLTDWWGKHVTKRPLYIGEDVERTVKFPDPSNPATHQMAAKAALKERYPTIQGSVLWYAKAAVDNVGQYGTLLRTTYWRYPALQPLMPFMDNKRPKKPKKVKALQMDNARVLFWTKPKGKKWGDEVKRYVVYGFAPGEKVDTDNPTKILTITSQTMFTLPQPTQSGKYTYVVTALDRVGNESKGVKEKVRYR